MFLVDKPYYSGAYFQFSGTQGGFPFMAKTTHIHFQQKIFGAKTLAASFT